jgi:hypothetical protein
MKFTRQKDNGFGSCWTISIGWLEMSWTRFEDHAYFAVMWARPIR